MKCWSVLVAVVFVATMNPSTVLGSSCVKPAEVEATSFTTQDATVVSEIAMVTEFSLKCSNGFVPTTLYAEIDGLITSVARVGEKFQVSWTEDIKTAQSGDRNVRIFDEEGFGVLRKALRSGDSISDISPLVTVVVNYPGAFAGPWLNSEFMALVMAIAATYIAVSVKAKLLG